MLRPLTSAAFAWRPEWAARALALFRADDDGFTDEEILTILRAGEAGLKIPDVCAAGGIRIVTYYAWKARYAGLTPSGVRNLRLRERRKRRQTTMAAFAALAVLSVGAAGMLLFTRNASQPQEASAANAPENPLESRPAPLPATVTIPAPAPNLQSAAAAGRAPQSAALPQPSPGADAAQPVGVGTGAPWVNAEDIQKADPDGYVVQVAAVPDLQEARAVLDQLAEAGYPAYLTATTIDRVELYRVRVGPLKSRHVAEDVARRLERDGHRAPWVTK